MNTFSLASALCMGALLNILPAVESPSPAPDAFSIRDTNADGILTRQEFESLTQQSKGHQQRQPVSPDNRGQEGELPPKERRCKPHSQQQRGNRPDHHFPEGNHGHKRPFKEHHCTSPDRQQLGEKSSQQRPRPLGVPPHHKQAFLQHFPAADMDKNKQLTLEEFRHLKRLIEAEHFTHLDRDHNGLLSVEELSAHPKRNPPPSQHQTPPPHNRP